MRVAIVLNASWNIVNFRMGLLKGIAAAGHEVIAIAPRDEFSDRIPFEYHELPMNARGTNPVRELGLLADMIRVFRKARPDVLLTFTPKPNIYGSLAARALGIPVIANVAGLGTMFTGGALARLLMEGLYRVAFGKTAHVFFQNEEDREYFTGKGIVPSVRSSRIYGSGVDLERFVPQASPSSPPLTFLLVSRLLWEKGVGDYVQAARMVKSAGIAARFRIAGIFDEGNPKAVSREQMTDWVSEGIVEFLGALDDVRDAISESDCLVLPSTYREGVPRVLIEGAALGRPLIAYENVGVGDVAISGRNGILAPAGDIGKLAAAMTDFAAMPESARTEMGRESRRIAEERFDEKRILQAYLSALDEQLP